MTQRLLLAGLAALSLSACSASQAETATATDSAAPAPAPAGAPVNSAMPDQPAAPPRNATFTLGGELTQGGWIRGIAPDGAESLSLGGTPVKLGPDGQFFAAFDRDAASGTQLVATMPDGKKLQRAITVSPRAWNIEHVNVARRAGGPSAAFMERRRPELARINAARSANADSNGWRQDFIWPVKGRISGRFGSQRVYRGEPGSYHSGIDITTGTSGTPFVAPADGVVVLAAQQPFSLEGYLLMIDHGAGLNSAFLHCSELLVNEGDSVRQGQVIGRIGMSGRATGPHLHWSLKWDNARLDPLLLVREPM